MADEHDENGSYRLLSSQNPIVVKNTTEKEDKVKTKVKLLTLTIMARYSRLQKQVLSLYRQFLRAARDKPGFTRHIREEFRKNASLPRTDGLRIEHLLRRGEKNLKELKKPECEGFGVYTKSN